MRTLGLAVAAALGWAPYSDASRAVTVYNGRDMEVYTEIDIAAAPADVWRVLTDFATYAAWNPIIKRIDGAPYVGSKIRFQIGLGVAGLHLPLDAEVVTAEPERELRWVGPFNRRLRQLASGSHYFRLEPLGEGEVRLCHGEVLSGWLVPGRFAPVENNMHKMYTALNRALKRRAEKR